MTEREREQVRAQARTHRLYRRRRASALVVLALGVVLLAISITTAFEPDVWPGAREVGPTLFGLGMVTTLSAALLWPVRLPVGGLR